jgi:rubrerythrin
MILHTTAEGITLARKLETDSAAFYQTLAQKYPSNAPAFLGLAEENKKNIINFERAYYGVITDAIEGCFAFNLDTDRYVLDTGIIDGISLAEAANQAYQMEEKIILFYQEAAEQSKPLMADVPRSFTSIANKRKNRILQIRSIQSP